MGNWHPSPWASFNVSYHARVKNTLDNTKIIIVSQVHEHETDNQLTDNTDSLTIYTLTPLFASA